MKRILKRAAVMLLTSSILGLLPEASAQEVLPPLSPAPSPLVLPTGTNIQPPVATPAPVNPSGVSQPIPLPMWTRDSQSATSTRMTSKPRIAVFAMDQASAPVDLLAVPTLPSSWAVESIKTPSTATKPPADGVPALTTTPARPALSGTRTPGLTVGRITLPPPALTTEVTPLPPPLPLFPADADSAASTEPSAARQAKASWAEQHPPVPSKANAWPSAFIGPEHIAEPVVKPSAVKEDVKREGTPEVLGPILPAVLQQKVARVCGGLAKDVKVAKHADQSLTVQVRAVNQSAERELMDRLLKLPELAAPNVRLELDLLP